LPTTLYLNKNKIVQIEPAFNISKSNWLTDKGRHYFDAMFKLNNKKQIHKLWSKFYNEIIIKVYIFEHCSKQMSQNYLVTIVFDFLSLELLGILSFISQNYSFITLKQIQSSSNAVSDLESGFQLNKTKLVNSTLCLLATTNPRYEGHVLNLNLRQRALKKNFKCILIGSLINLTFPVTFIGSDTGILKTITEGNHFMCQNLKHSKNPFLFCNNELFKRNDTNTIKTIFKTFFYLNFFNKM